MNDPHVIRISGIVALVLAAVLVHFKWNRNDELVENPNPGDQGAQIRSSREKGTRSPQVPRRNADQGSPNANPTALPLSRTPNPSTSQCLEALASGTLEADRVRAAMLLGNRAQEPGLSEKAVPALVNALEQDQAAQVWLVAAQALGKYGPRAAEAVPVLMKWLDHETMRNISMDALADIGGPAEPAIALLSPIALDPAGNFINRRKAIRAIARIGGSGHADVMEVLNVAATDIDPRIRKLAGSPLMEDQPVIATPGVTERTGQ